MKKPKSTNDLRKAFLEFFQSHGHTLVASDSLVPQNDPSLLFTGSGMNQFKEYFLGVKKDLKRATTSQKCLRTGDLDEVGRTPYHHSFFEMLGNFSFGDYFKKEAIEWSWEFLTRVLSIPRERLRVTVHEKDQEAFDIWHQLIGLPEAWITRCGDKTNFWPANAPALGPNGPCGPCSEIYYDQHPEKQGTPVEDTGKYAEIWNLVFTQYDRHDGGKLVPLKCKNIDTGMGLERLACVLQGKTSNFEIDIFEPIHEAILQALALKPPDIQKKSLYCISDHLRAVVFSIADGVIPSNEGRGYVIRKLIRRAIWQAHQLVPEKKLSRPFLYKAAPAVIRVMGEAYPELSDSKENITAILSQEEERFLRTLDDGLRILNTHLAAFQQKQITRVPAKIIFELYDTYGFPEELTQGIAAAEGLEIDHQGFEKLMMAQRIRSKESSKISNEIFSASILNEIPAGIPATRFLGYEVLKSTASILWHQTDRKNATVILDQTPFYAESGGQIGDQGLIEGKGLKLQVNDTQKLDRFFLHQVEILDGNIKDQAPVTATVDRSHRDAIMRNHTATHLLHAALRKTLGSSVRQLGSMVADDRLRFDFSFGRALSADELRIIEQLVNEQIQKNVLVQKQIKSVEEAKREGALAFFGDKYGAQVRMIQIPEFSKELCGGTHCESTGQIGLFLVVAESSVASGVRRIEAVTGGAALHYVYGMQDQLSEISRILKVGIADIPLRITKLMENMKKQKNQAVPAAFTTADAKKMVAEAPHEDSCTILVRFLENSDMTAMRHLSDLLKSMNLKLVYVLATTLDQKLNILAGISMELAKTSFDMKALFVRLSPLLGVTGGGRKDLIQGGGVDQGQFLPNVTRIEQMIREHLTEKRI